MKKVFQVEAVKIGNIQAPVALDARQERQDCAKSAKVKTGIISLLYRHLGVLALVLALLASI
jgi:hypothetical protein